MECAGECGGEETTFCGLLVVELDCALDASMESSRAEIASNCLSIAALIPSWVAMVFDNTTKD